MHGWLQQSHVGRNIRHLFSATRRILVQVLQLTAVAPAEEHISK